MIDFAAENLISLKIDAEKDAGPELRDRFRLPGYPTIVFTNAAGNEVDRIVGYRPVDVFLAELTRIRANRGTIADLTARFEANPAIDSLAVQIAEKYEERQDRLAALSYWLKALNIPDGDQEMARYRIASNQTLLTESDRSLKEYLAGSVDETYFADAYNVLQRFYRSQKDTSAEVDIYVRLMEFLERKSAATSADLNGYAWRMSQLEINLEDALAKIRRAVVMAADELPEDRAGLMDTEAEVLWKLGRSAEALTIIEQCIKLQPEDQYFKDQKTKFQKQ